MTRIKSYDTLRREAENLINKPLQWTLVKKKQPLEDDPGEDDGESKKEAKGEAEEPEEENEEENEEESEDEGDDY